MKRLRNPVRESWAKSRSRNLMIRTNKKSHRTVEVADPDFGGTGVEVEDAFFVDLGWGVRWGKDFDADFWCASKYDGSVVKLWTVACEPGEVEALHPIRGGKRAFGKWPAPREEPQQQNKHLALTVGVEKPRRRSHKNMSVPIRLDPVGEPGEFRVSHELTPTGEVEGGLQLEIGKLNGDRHRQ